MTRRLLLSYVLMAVIILAMLTVPLGINLAGKEHDRLLVAIERDARVLAAEADDSFENHNFVELPGLVRDYVRQSGGRVVMVDATGASVVDSSDLTGGAVTSRPAPRSPPPSPGASRPVSATRRRWVDRCRSSSCRSATSTR